MGDQLLKNIVSELNDYIKSVKKDEADSSSPSPQSTTKIVVLDNVATSKLAGGDNGKLDNHIILSLVNVAEEGTLKNKTSRTWVGGQSIEQPPPVHVNLYLLFTANFSTYSSAIGYLFRVLEFFQGRKIFRLKNAVMPTADLEEKEDYTLEMDLHTLSFEQLNDLWGSLGGKQMPFILYRARLVTIRMQRPTGRSGMITEIEMDTEKKELIQ